MKVFDQSGKEAKCQKPTSQQTLYGISLVAMLFRLPLDDAFSGCCLSKLNGNRN
jgi:hypothetical protein